MIPCISEWIGSRRGRALFQLIYVFVQVIKVVDVKRTLTWKFYVTRILPVGFFMALTLHFGNTVYLYLTVSFIQMLKARTARCQAHMKLIHTSLHAVLMSDHGSPILLRAIGHRRQINGLLLT